MTDSDTNTMTIDGNAGDEDLTMKDYLQAYIGPNSHKYENAINSVIANKQKMTWIWAAFFAPFAWLVYRKLYVHALAILIAIIGFGLIVPSNSGIGVSLGVIIAMLYKVAYVKRAKKQISEILADRLNPEDTMAQIQALGGVSKTAGIIAGGLHILPLMLIIFAVFYS